MKLLMIFLGTIFGIIIFLGILFLIAYVKLLKYGKKLGFKNLGQIKNIINDGTSSYGYNSKIKSVSGMTKLLLPSIVRDFPNFSESELYNKTETSLLAIFKSLEEQKVENINELSLIKNNLLGVIDDLKQNDVNLSFDNIRFHSHAIKYYKKSSGALCITVSSSVEYFYEKKVGDKVVVKRKDEPRQTLYESEFIYIYDPDKYEREGQRVIGIICPNCGGAVKSLGAKRCEYCNSGLEDINLKSWYISSYKKKY